MILYREGVFFLTNKKIKKLVLCALLSAICYILTLFTSIPALYTKGFVNLGDLSVALCAYVAGGAFGALSASIGSVLADISMGFALYAPATFIIKGIMALIESYFFIKAKHSKKRVNIVLNFIFGCVLAEAFMVMGYFAFEYLLYGIAAAVSVTGNVIQSLVSVVASLAVIPVFKNNKIISKMSESMK